MTVSTLKLKDWPAIYSATSRRAFIKYITVLVKTKGEISLRASLDNVVVRGGPPVDNRICNLVSFASLLDVEPATVAGVGAATGVASIT